jgi:rSAM/selenodomain-associated transferase 1
MRRVVTVMAKDPKPGVVKTRLAPVLGPAGAAGLYRAMVQDVLDATMEVRGVERFLHVQPDAARAWYDPVAQGRFTVRVQRGASLSERMVAAFDELFAGGRGAVVMRNSDSPTLPASLVEQALTALEGGADVVLGPDRGGGYCLVGLRERRPDLFHGVAMSTTTVLEETTRRARLLKLRAVVLEPWLDVDTPEDLDALRRELAPGGTASRARCERTEAFLAGTASLRQRFPPLPTSRTVP